MTPDLDRHATTIGSDEGEYRFDDTLAGDVRDPYPELSELREATPVIVSPDGSSVTVFRYDDVDRVLRDNETFSSAHLTEVMGPAMGQRIILGMDEPEHRRHRALVAQAFSAKTLARWEDGLVRRVVEDLVNGFRGDGRAELVGQFTARFPARVIAGVLGLPDEDNARFQRWAVAIVGLHTDFERGVAASRELRAYLAEVLDERRRAPREDLISALVQAEIDGERLDDEEIYSFLMLLLPAGVETTYRSSGNLLHLLLTHPDQLAAVRDERSLLTQAIEEALRMEPPLLLISRVAARDGELGGVRFRAGAAITPMLGAANRDPRRYPDPDRFDIFRDPKQHISFGHGPHMCLGMHLARLETRVAVDALLDLPNLRLDPDAREPDGDVPHIHGQVFRSPTSLPVLFDT